MDVVLQREDAFRVFSIYPNKARVMLRLSLIFRDKEIFLWVVAKDFKQKSLSVLHVPVSPFSFRA
jgi:hypothetical protein